MKVPEEYNASIAGMSIEECAVYTKERWNLEESTEDIIDEWNEGVRRQYLEKIGLKPGAKEYLQMLKKRGVILGVATALSTELLVPCLKRLQVYSLFDAVVSVDQVDCGGKKTAAVYTRAMGQMGIKPEECVIFEDTLAGIEEAKRTGARVYCMSDEVSRRLQPEIEKRSDSLFENFFELLPGQRELLPDGEEKAFAAGIRACGLRAADEKNELSD